MTGSGQNDGSRPCPRPCLAAALLILTITMPDFAGGAKTGFTTPQPLTPTILNIPRTVNPAVAGDAEGRFVAVFEVHARDDSTSGPLYVSVYENGAWSAEAPLLPGFPSLAATDPAIDTDANGHWVVVWSSTDGPSGPDADVYGAISADNGKTWSGPSLINSGGAADISPDAYDIQPVLKTDRTGRWIVIWRHNAFGGEFGSDDDLLYSISTDNGASWSAQAPFNKTAHRDGGFDIEPRIAMDSMGLWVVVWQSNASIDGLTGSDIDIHYSRSTDSGATWTSPLPLNPNAATDSGRDIHPDIAVSPEGTWCANWRGDPSTWQVRSTSGASNWGVSAQNFIVSKPRLLALGGGRWIRNFETFYGDRYQFSEDDAQNWLETAGGGGARAVLATSRGRVMRLFGAWYQTLDRWPEQIDGEIQLSPPDYPRFNGRIRIDWPTYPVYVDVSNTGLHPWENFQVHLVSDSCNLFPDWVDKVGGALPGGGVSQVSATAVTPPRTGLCDFVVSLSISSEILTTATLQVDIYHGYAATLIGAPLPDPVRPGDSFNYDIRMRNTGAVDWTTTGSVYLEPIVDDCSLFAGSRPALVSRTNRNQEGVFRVNFQAPLTESVCSLVLQPRFHLQLQSGVADEFFGAPISMTIPITNTYVAFHFQNNQADWTGAILQGSGIIRALETGICMYAPNFGENIMAWTSSPGLVPLVDKAVYRLNMDAFTDQIQVNSIPLWDVTYANFYDSGFGSTYGGQVWFLDVAGGANGIGRPEGRSVFEAYAAPNAMLTPQWRGTIGGGPVGSNGGAFTPEVDAFNDMRIATRVLDLDSAGVNANIDFGTVCFSRLRVFRMDFDSFVLVDTSWSPQISPATLAAQTLTQEAEMAGRAEITDGTAIYQLAASGPGSRKTLIPLDAAAAGIPALYPVFWRSDHVYRGISLIESRAGGGMGDEGSDPVDAIFLNFDTPTNELGAIHYSTRGSADNMDLAASPRLAASAGGPQPYVAFFAGNNRTLWPEPGTDRLRLMTDLFNIDEIAPDGLGSDPLAITGTAIGQVQPPY